MAQKDGLNFNINIDPNNYSWNSVENLRNARRAAVEAAGMVWADETKNLVRTENHIDTSLYINSIGYITDYPADPTSEKGKYFANENDVIYDIIENEKETTLRIGSAVRYAEKLEKRFSLMARGLDIARPRMDQVAQFQINKHLNGGGGK